MCIKCIVESNTIEAIKENGLTTEKLITNATFPPTTVTANTTLVTTNGTNIYGVSLVATNTQTSPNSPEDTATSTDSWTTPNEELQTTSTITEETTSLAEKKSSETTQLTRTQSTTMSWTAATSATSRQKETDTSESSSIQNVVNESGSGNDTDMLFNSTNWNSSNWDTSNWTGSSELFDYMTAFFAADLSAILNSLLLLLLSLAMYANI